MIDLEEIEKELKAIGYPFDPNHMRSIERFIAKIILISGEEDSYNFILKSPERIHALVRLLEKYRKALFKIGYEVPESCNEAWEENRYRIETARKALEE